MISTLMLWYLCFKNFIRVTVFINFFANIENVYLYSYIGGRSSYFNTFGIIFCNPMQLRIMTWVKRWLQESKIKVQKKIIKKIIYVFTWRAHTSQKKVASSTLTCFNVECFCFTANNHCMTQRFIKFILFKFVLCKFYQDNLIKLWDVNVHNAYPQN